MNSYTTMTVLPMYHANGLTERFPGKNCLTRTLHLGYEQLKRMRRTLCLQLRYSKERSKFPRDRVLKCLLQAGSSTVMWNIFVFISSGNKVKGIIKLPCGRVTCSHRAMRIGSRLFTACCKSIRAHLFDWTKLDYNRRH